MKFIDNLLNRITMYRLVLYTLCVYWAIGFIFNIFGILNYGALAMIYEAVIILVSCWFLNELLARIFKVPANVESFYITALILMLIVSPAPLTMSYVFFLVLASVGAIASKFVLNIQRKHIFNPAAFGVALTALLGIGYASWWIGTASMLPFVLAGGFLIIRKVQRWNLVFSFMAVAFAEIVLIGLTRNAAPLSSLQRGLLDSSIIFFASIMLTEPLTMPPTQPRRVLYGLLTGALFSPAVHFGNLYMTPELALLIGNIFSYLISPKFRLMLTLNQKTKMAADIYDFSFMPDRKINFRPGQYLEWTLGHKPSDSRGNRRYFTIASSPTEAEIKMGVKFYPEASSFKRSLQSLAPGQRLFVSQLAGDFILPKDVEEKLVLIAGGIGITPYRSMAKYLTDRNEVRDIILIYSAKAPTDFVYQDVFKAAEDVGWWNIYTASDVEGYLTADRLKKEVPDYKERMFYISGPRSMVVVFQDTLKKLGIPKSRIKTDFFPGFV